MFVHSHRTGTVQMKKACLEEGNLGVGATKVRSPDKTQRDRDYWYFSQGTFGSNSRCILNN